jgi:GntR family transcriptional regulator, rspAB operon transcriptional repressor
MAARAEREWHQAKTTTDGGPRLVGVFDAIRRAIVLNEQTPGSALTEMALAAAHGCSQGTVREALLRLQEEGLVVRAGYRGTLVSALDAEEAALMLAVRKQLECEAVKRLPFEDNSALVAELAAHLDGMRMAAHSADTYALICHDTAFHLALFRAAQLPALEPILRRTNIHTHRFKLWAPEHQRPLKITAERHQPLLDAVVAGDRPALETLLVRHLDTIVEPWPDCGSRGDSSPSAAQQREEKER